MKLYDDKNMKKSLIRYNYIKLLLNFNPGIYLNCMRTRLYAIISIPLFAILYFETALVVLLLLILAWLNLKRTVRFIAQLWAKSIFLIIGKRFKIHGLENIKKGEKYILVANHGSLFDIVAIMSFYRGLCWFGHERLLKVPLFNKILKMTDYVPFKKPTIKNTKDMIEQLVSKSKCNTVAIFPEGTRTTDGQINDFYKGFIYLFRSTGTQILPVTLNGFFMLKPKTRFYIKFDSKLDIVVHKPITREELIGKTDAEIIESVKGIIESAYI
jgi:1-acyl-sn-glycerol-3-phosphate acyltransferase